MLLIRISVRICIFDFIIRLFATASHIDRSINVWIATLFPFSSQTSYVDTISLRKSLPDGYDDPRLITTRRLYPNVPIFPNELAVISTPNDKKFTLRYKPNNCLNNLSTVSIRNFPEASITRLGAANPPVTGAFNVSWNGTIFNEIAANIDERSLKNYLESVKQMGQVTVERSKNCAGYKWRIKWQSGGSKPQLSIILLMFRSGSQKFYFTKYFTPKAFCLYLNSFMKIQQIYYINQIH
ncbi:fibrocystin-L isoform X1 [Brachionus plicatilis]|uniref:Fibrocystin-L isoform X1 n=1 Tax=Brachionus plicatilis TaxID=10195 RepID=A0A3M7P8P2_BRAPC|nr:fibrocystin-L isoform X1 [Brachionus plicatilis]